MRGDYGRAIEEEEQARARAPRAKAVLDAIWAAFERQGFPDQAMLDWERYAQVLAACGYGRMGDISYAQEVELLSRLAALEVEL